MIGRNAWKSSRKFVAALLTALALGIAGCGGDDEQASTAPAATVPAETEPAVTVPAETEVATETEPEPAETETTPPAESPEEQPGGAGDEEPARALALFTGRDGRITPRVVRVPAFIAVRVELRSADGAPYGLRFGDVEITAGGEVGSRARTLDGLRPDEAIVGVPIGAGNRVRVEATAEPGP